MSHLYLNTVDYTVITAYVCGMIGLGIYLKKRASSSLENYLVGGRSIPWWMLGISGMSQYFDVAGTMVITSFLFMLGPRGLFIEFRGGASLILVIMLLWTGKWHRRSGCLTGAEWMTYRFGDQLAGRTAQFARAITGIVMTIGLLTFLIKGIGLFLSMFLPFSPMQCAFGLFAAATLYIMFTGFYGVVFSDLLQAIVVIVSAISITIVAMGKVPDLAGLSRLANSVTNNPQWIEASPRLHTHMPPGYEQYQALLFIASVYVIRNLIFGLGVGDDPKYFGASSDKDCSKLTLLWICLLSVRWPMMIGMAVLGLFIVDEALPDATAIQRATELVQSHLTTNEETWSAVTSSIANSPDSQPEGLVAGLESELGADWKSNLLLVGYHGSVDPERIMPAVLLYHIPAGLRGLMLVAIIAGSLSSFDAMVNSTAGLFVRDIYQKHVRPQAKVRELMVATWLFIVVLVASAFTFAFTVKSINDIWVWFLMSLGGGLVAPLVLRFYWWRFNGFGFAIGCFTGISAAVVQRLASNNLPEQWQFLNSESWTFLSLGCIGLAASVIGSLLTPPTPESVLRKFYLTTLPFGAWSRFKKYLPKELRGKVTAEHRRDIAAVPFALMFQILIYLSPMLLLIHNWSAGLICLTLAALSFAGLYWIWLRFIQLSDVNWNESLRFLDKQNQSSSGT